MSKNKDVLNQKIDTLETKLTKANKGSLHPRKEVAIKNIRTWTNLKWAEMLIPVDKAIKKEN
jgi:hypothetical protein